MYEAQTYELILQRMLDRISSDFDKREGSIIFDALAPAALELQNMYQAFDNMMNETFGDTASMEYLIRLCAERGIEPYPSTKSIVNGVFTPVTLEVPVGSRFNCTNSSYIVTEKISNGVYKLQCEENGIVGNQFTGDIIPIDYVSGLETAAITEILIYGEDDELVEDLRTRYFASFDEKSFSGNRADYQEKTLAIAGVGAVKITPVWDGAGTVKLTILNSVFGKATNTLIETVQDEFDPNGDGKGGGLAPIGHVVTADTCNEVTVNISTTIIFDSGYDFNSRSALITAAMNAYMLELRTIWASQSALIVRIAQIEAKILSIVGIIDISGTSINSVANNLTLTAFQIPIQGVITVA